MYYIVLTLKETKLELNSFNKHLHAYGTMLSEITFRYRRIILGPPIIESWPIGGNRSALVCLRITRVIIVQS